MKYFRTPYLQLENYALDENVVNIIPEELCRQFQVVALEVWGNLLTVGMVRPENEEDIKILKEKTKYNIIPFRVDIKEWANALNNIVI